jgi:hypothetical protein
MAKTASGATWMLPPVGACDALLPRPATPEGRLTNSSLIMGAL